jgi:hypothetical protein
MQEQPEDLIRQVAFFRISGAHARGNVSVAYAEEPKDVVVRPVRLKTALPNQAAPARESTAESVPLARASGDDVAWREF